MVCSGDGGGGDVGLSALECYFQTEDVSILGKWKLMFFFLGTRRTRIDYIAAYDISGREPCPDFVRTNGFDATVKPDGDIGVTIKRYITQTLPFDMIGKICVFLMITKMFER